jgi:predicted MFS family arabinose efflux permease
VQHVSWRWIFWVNVPFSVVSLILAWRLMPSFPGSGKSRLDAVGLALVSPGIAAVVYGLAQVGLAGGFRHASAYIGLDRTEVPHASIITRTAQQIGGSFGTAVLAVVLERALTQHALAGLDGRATAFDVAFWWSIAFTAMAVVLAFWLPNRGPS